MTTTLHRAVITAVTAERDAVAEALHDRAAVRVGPYEALRGRGRDGEVLVVAGGIGPAAAAACAATVVATAAPAELVSMGIGGAFTGARLASGDVALASTIVFADLGAASPERFLDLNALGLDGGAAVETDAAQLTALRDLLSAAGLHVAVGPVLTLATTTGTNDRATELMALHGAVAEAMEGAGIAHVAVLNGLPVLELRTISNQVGDRDRDAWDLPAALGSLRAAALAWLGPE